MQHIKWVPNITKSLYLFYTDEAMSKKCRYQTKPEIHTDTRSNVTINNNDND